MQATRSTKKQQNADVDSIWRDLPKSFSASACFALALPVVKLLLLRVALDRNARLCLDAEEVTSLSAIIGALLDAARISIP
jgi:hypothetical protein